MLDFAICKPPVVGEQFLFSLMLKKKYYIKVCKNSPQILDTDLSLLDCLELQKESRFSNAELVYWYKNIEL